MCLGITFGSGSFNEVGDWNLTIVKESILDEGFLGLGEVGRSISGEASIELGGVDDTIAVGITSGKDLGGGRDVVPLLDLEGSSGGNEGKELHMFVLRIIIVKQICFA